MEEEQTIADILSSIRQVLSKEAATLNGDSPIKSAPKNESVETVFELTPQMQLSTGLVTPQTALKTRDALDKLEAFKETPSQTEWAEKELEPFLKDWLNQHLPEIVEKVVTREVRRIINRN